MVIFSWLIKKSKLLLNKNQQFLKGYEMLVVVKTNIALIFSSLLFLSDILNLQGKNKNINDSHNDCTTSFEDNIKKM